MKTHNFKRLEMYSGSPGELMVTCKVTKQRKVWNTAAVLGWCADLNGEPFNAYYSPEAINEMALTPDQYAAPETPLIQHKS